MKKYITPAVEAVMFTAEKIMDTSVNIKTTVSHNEVEYVAEKVTNGVDYSSIFFNE